MAGDKKNMQNIIRKYLNSGEDTGAMAMVSFIISSYGSTELKHFIYISRPHNHFTMFTRGITVQMGGLGGGGGGKGVVN